MTMTSNREYVIYNKVYERKAVTHGKKKEQEGKGGIALHWWGCSDNHSVDD